MSKGDRRRTIQAMLVLGVTYALGAVSGAGFWQWAYLPSPRTPGNGPIPVEALDLTPEQEREVEAIIQRHRPEVRAVFQENQPRIEAINARVLSEVREVLSEEQRDRLDAIRVQARPSGNGHRPPPPGGRRPGGGRPGGGGRGGDPPPPRH